MSASTVEAYSSHYHQDLPMLTLSQIADAFFVLMNTPLVPAEATKQSAGRDVPLTDMPAGSRSSRERRRRVCHCNITLLLVHYLPSVQSNDSSISTDSSFSTSRFAPTTPVPFTSPHFVDESFETDGDSGAKPLTYDVS